MPAYGWSPERADPAAAAVDGFDVLGDLDSALDRARADDALVVLAAPVTAFRALLEQINHRTPRSLLTDVASVKGPVAKSVAELAPQARFVGSHPMAGTQHSGWAAGSADLFTGAAWVTCMDEDTDAATWIPVAKLALALGSQVVPIEAAAHDRGGGPDLAPAAPARLCARPGRRQRWRPRHVARRVVLRRRHPGSRHPAGADAGDVREQRYRR